MSRVELCINTRFGGYSIVNIDKLIERAKELDLKGIAFTDLDDVNAFYKVKDNKELDIIYGTSLKVLYKDKNIRVFLLVQDQEGLKNLYKVMTLANTTYLDSVIPIEEVMVDGILIGINVTDVSIYNRLKDVNDSDVFNYVNIFDYVLVSTIDDHDYIKRFVNLCDKNNKIVCATNDIRYLLKEDKRAYDEYKENNYTDNYLMSDEELISNFDYLGDVAKKIVVDNTLVLNNKINKSITLIPDIKYSSYLDELKKLISSLEKNIVDVNHERINEELLYMNEATAYCLLINYKLINFSRKNKYEMFTRGNISSSYIAYILGISNINPIEYNIDTNIYNKDNILNFYINYDENAYKKIIDYLYKTYKNKVVRCGTLKLHTLTKIKKGYGRLIGAFYVIPDDTSLCDFTPVINLVENTSMIDFPVFKNKLVRINILANTITSLYNELINESKINNIKLNDIDVFKSITNLNIPEIDLYTNDFEGSSIDDLVKHIAINNGNQSAIEDGIIFKDDLDKNRAEFLLYKSHVIELALVIYKIFYIRHYKIDIFNKIAQKYEHQ